MDVAAGPTLPHDTVVDLLDGVEVLAPLSGEEIDAPTSLGGPLEVLADAPGTYVFDK